jgi:uncharacterized protein (DUF1330 family)
MKRLALLVVALVFAFTTTVMAQDKPAAAPANVEKAKPVYVTGIVKVTNWKMYRTYILSSVSMLKKAGAQMILAEYESEVFEGDPGPITIVIKFPSREALFAMYNSPEYAKIKHLRHDSTKGDWTIAGEFDMAKNLRLLNGPLFQQ